jgi:hypothetical protein
LVIIGAEIIRDREQAHSQEWQCHLIYVGGEEDVPELGGRSEELDGDEGAFLIELGGAHDVDLDAFLRFGIFENELGARGQALRKNDHGAGGADGVGVADDGFRLAGKVGVHFHPQEDALGAAAFFRSALAHERGAHGRVRTGFGVQTGFGV